jgi:hypothetical protein
LKLLDNGKTVTIERYPMPYLFGTFVLWNAFLLANIFTQVPEDITVTVLAFWVDLSL